METDRPKCGCGDFLICEVGIGRWRCFRCWPLGDSPGDEPVARVSSSEMFYKQPEKVCAKPGCDSERYREGTCLCLYHWEMWQRIGLDRDFDEWTKHPLCTQKDCCLDAVRPSERCHEHTISKGKYRPLGDSPERTKCIQQPSCSNDSLETGPLCAEHEERMRTDARMCHVSGCLNDAISELDMRFCAAHPMCSPTVEGEGIKARISPVPPGVSFTPILEIRANGYRMEHSDPPPVKASCVVEPRSPQREDYRGPCQFPGCNVESVSYGDPGIKSVFCSKHAICSPMTEGTVKAYADQLEREAIDRPRCCCGEFLSSMGSTEQWRCHRCWPLGDWPESGQPTQCRYQGCDKKAALGIIFCQEHWNRHTEGSTAVGLCKADGCENREVDGGWCDDCNRGSKVCPYHIGDENGGKCGIIIPSSAEYCQNHMLVVGPGPTSPPVTRKCESCDRYTDDAIFDEEGGTAECQLCANGNSAEADRLYAAMKASYSAGEPLMTTYCQAKVEDGDEFRGKNAPGFKAGECGVGIADGLTFCSMHREYDEGIRTLADAPEYAKPVFVFRDNAITKVHPSDLATYEAARLAFNSYAAMAPPDLPEEPMARLQVELCRWQAREFGGGDITDATLGVNEEVGELSDALLALTAIKSGAGRLAHAVLKRKQGIRGFDNVEKYREDAADAIADIMVFAMQAATCLRLDAWTNLEETAKKVMGRKWSKKQILAPENCAPHPGYYVEHTDRVDEQLAMSRNLKGGGIEVVSTVEAAKTCDECGKPLGKRYSQDVPGRGDLCLECHDPMTEAE